MKKLKLSIIIKIIAILSSIYGMIFAFRGMMSFTYFTILSNIFSIVMLGIFLYKDIKELKGKKITFNNNLYFIKFLSALSITITFLVFLFIIAPTYPDGFIGAYFNKYFYTSFFLHIVVPILSIIDFLYFNNEYKIEKKHALYAMIPPLIYTIYIYILELMGVVWEGGMHAPYNFINYRTKVGWFGFDLSTMGYESLGIGVFYNIIILSLIFYGIGLLLLKMKKKIEKKS